MSLVESLQVLHERRRDEIIVTVMGTAREWMGIGSHPLDFVYVPSSMGQATSLGLGLALARPDKRVIVCNGDGSMLMNLGSLVSISAAAPQNLTILLFDNGVYEVTGAQSTPGSKLGRNNSGAVDYADLARACGFGHVHQFATLESWRIGLPEMLTANGPIFGHVKVAPIPGAVGPKSPGPAADRAKAFMSQLNSD